MLLPILSGNTEETLSSVDVAIKAGATIVAVTTGGKLKDMINEGVIAGAVVEDIETNPSRFPKSGLEFLLEHWRGLVQNRSN